jgi:hypothetical protein
MNKTDRIKLAKSILADALRLGLVPGTKGDFVVFTPPLPTSMLIRGMDCGDELFAEVEKYLESKK